MTEEVDKGYDAIAPLWKSRCLALVFGKRIALAGADNVKQELTFKSGYELEGGQCGIGPIVELSLQSVWVAFSVP